MTIPGKGGVNFSITAEMASVPPVDAPMAIRSIPPEPVGIFITGSGGETVGRGGGGETGLASGRGAKRGAGDDEAVAATATMWLAAPADS